MADYVYFGAAACYVAAAYLLGVAVGYGRGLNDRRADQ